MLLQRQAAIAQGVPREKTLQGKPWDLDVASTVKREATNAAGNLRSSGNYHARVIEAGNWYGVYVRLAHRA